MLLAWETQFGMTYVGMTRVRVPLLCKSNGILDTLPQDNIIGSEEVFMYRAGLLSEEET